MRKIVVKDFTKRNSAVAQNKVGDGLITHRVFWQISCSVCLQKNYENWLNYINVMSEDNVFFWDAVYNMSLPVIYAYNNKWK